MSVPASFVIYARRALQWIAFAERPLYIEEVAEAATLKEDCSIEPGRRFSNPYDIVDICSGLITTNEVQEDEKTRIHANFSHSNIKEYLLSDEIKTSPVKAFSVTEVETQDLISQMTIEYQLSAIRIDADPNTEQIPCPLLQYAQSFWYTHYMTTRIEEMGPRSMSASIIELFDLKRNESMLIGDFTVILEAPEGPNLVHQSSLGFPPPLYFASLLNLQAVVRQLLQRGDEIDKIGGFCGTALQAAAYGGHTNIITRLLEFGAGAGTQSGHFGNALQAAANQGHLVSMQLLLDAGADVNSACGYYGNALQAAASGGHEGALKWLIEFGADVNAQGGEHASALIAAARGGHHDIARMLLENGADMNIREAKQNATALYVAAAFGQDDIVGLLLDLGANPNVEGGEYGSALRAAARGGFGAIVERLVRSGAKLDPGTTSGRDAGASTLHLAVVGGHEDVVQMLLKRRSVNPNAVSQDGLSPLTEAAVGGHKAVVELLLDKGANLETKDKAGATALLRAVKSGHQEVADLLVKRGADVQTKDSSERTPLFVAAEAGQDGLVQLLLDGGADPNISTPLGKTALLQAVEKQHETVVKILLEADTNMSLLSCQSALDMAKKQGNDDIVQTIEAHIATKGKSDPSQSGTAAESLKAKPQPMRISKSDSSALGILDRLDPETRATVSRVLQDHGIDLARIASQEVSRQLKEKRARSPPRPRPRPQIEVVRPRRQPRSIDPIIHIYSSDESDSDPVERRSRASHSGIVRRRDSFEIMRPPERPVIVRERRYHVRDRSDRPGFRRSVEYTGDDTFQEKLRRDDYRMSIEREQATEEAELRRRRLLEHERRMERIEMDYRMMDDMLRRSRRESTRPDSGLQIERRRREHSMFYR